MLIKCLQRAQKNGSDLSDIEQLAILVVIRETIGETFTKSTSGTFDVIELQNTVNVVSFIKTTCQKVLSCHTQQSELYRYMALEITWIMTNIAMGPKQIIEDMFFDKDQQN